MYEVDGMPVGVAEFAEPMEVLSCAVMNGGVSTASCAFIMQVPKDYCCDDPDKDAIRVRDALGLPSDALGMMTAAEVDYVFNVRSCTFNGAEASVFATAGLSNHVVAGEEIRDYGGRSLVSLRRAREMRAGTINIGVVSSVPMTMEGRVNLMIPLVEAKCAAMAEHGFRETGTTSDAMAVFSPIGSDPVSWTGTGSDIGIAAARAVSAAVGHALDVRNEHPIPIGLDGIMERMGLGPEDLRRMSGTGIPADGFRDALRGIAERPDVAAALDAAWFIADRADSLSDDGGPELSDAIVDGMARMVGGSPVSDGCLMDRVMGTIARRAGGLRWRAALSARWCRSSRYGPQT